MSDDEFYTNHYIRKLVLEAPYIKARLQNPGGSVILTGTAADTEQPQEYSSQIGSGFHLDLIETEIKFAELPNDQKKALVAWAQGASPKEASMYFAAKGAVLRKRRERGVDSLTQKMNEDESPIGDRETTGRMGQRDTSKGSSRYRRVT